MQLLKSLSLLTKFLKIGHNDIVVYEVTYYFKSCACGSVLKRSGKRMEPYTMVVVGVLRQYP